MECIVEKNEKSRRDENAAKSNYFFHSPTNMAGSSVVHAWNTLASFFPVPPMLVTFISGTKWELSCRLKDSYHAKFSEAQILSASV